MLGTNQVDFPAWNGEDRISYSQIAKVEAMNVVKAIYIIVFVCSSIG